MFVPAASVIAPVASVKLPLTNVVGAFAKAVWGRIRAFGWSKRDWIAAAVGGGAVMLVQGLLWLAGKLFGS